MVIHDDDGKVTRDLSERRAAEPEEKNARVVAMPTSSVNPDDELHALHQ